MKNCHTSRIFLALLLSTLGNFTHAGEPAPLSKANPAMAEVTDDPKLPRVLLIGDSISIGYTVPVREHFKDKANVHRPRTNCESTRHGLKQLDTWLGAGKWDVIHFNWGLHDLKYIDASNKMTDVKTGKQQVLIDEYEKNLRELVGRLKKTGAKLIWCATSPIPAGVKGRIPGDELKYNEAAARVMKEEGVTINDLHAFAAPKLAEIQLKADVHYNVKGSKDLAAQVSSMIEAALAAGK